MVFERTMMQGEHKLGLRKAHRVYLKSDKTAVVERKESHAKKKRVEIKMKKRTLLC